MKCKAINQNGNPCRAEAGTNSGYCFMHDPSRREEQALARSKGGQRLRAPHHGDPSLIPAQIRSAKEILLVLDYALAEALPLENSVERCRMFVAICSAYKDVIELSQYAAKLTALERAKNFEISITPEPRVARIPLKRRKLIRNESKTQN